MTLNTTSEQVGTEKSFGVVFSIVFLIIALYPLINFNVPNYWALAVSTIFILLAFFVPKLLYFPNIIWFKFGVLISLIISPFVMVILYLVTIIPTALVIKVLGKDLLRIRLDQSAKTYWIKRDEPIGSMKNQF